MVVKIGVNRHSTVLPRSTKRTTEPINSVFLKWFSDFRLIHEARRPERILKQWRRKDNERCRLAYQVCRVVEKETRDLISCNDLDSVFGRVGHRICAVLFFLKKTGCQHRAPPLFHRS